MWFGIIPMGDLWVLWSCSGDLGTRSRAFFTDTGVLTRSRVAEGRAVQAGISVPLAQRSESLALGRLGRIPEGGHCPWILENKWDFSGKENE